MFKVFYFRLVGFSVFEFDDGGGFGSGLVFCCDRGFWFVIGIFSLGLGSVGF